jgi:hypothetical protein
MAHLQYHSIKTFFSFAKQNRPPKDNSFPFRVFNLQEIVSITDLPVANLLGLAPRGKPRHILGREPLMHLTISAIEKL